MEQQNNFKLNGEKSTGFIMIRMTANQKLRLKTLAEGSGQSVSEYIRQNLLSPDIHNKLNNILNLLQETKSSSREQEKQKK